jgi:hypothetical protein
MWGCSPAPVHETKRCRYNCQFNTGLIAAIVANYASAGGAAYGTGLLVAVMQRIPLPEPIRIGISVLVVTLTVIRRIPPACDLPADVTTHPEADPCGAKSIRCVRGRELY